MPSVSYFSETEGPLHGQKMTIVTLQGGVLFEYLSVSPDVLCVTTREKGVTGCTPTTFNRAVNRTQLQSTTDFFEPLSKSK